MVGLSVILENDKNLPVKMTPRVISKGSMIKPPSSSPNPSTLSGTTPVSPSGFSWKETLGPYSGFLDRCFLCKQKLLPGKDVYMYKGDKAFCSVECRCRQIFMDEEDSTIAKKVCTSSREYNCSLAAIRGHQPCTISSPSSSRSGKGARNRLNAFAC